MQDNRKTRAKKNIITSLSGQIVTLLCGLVVPRLLIQTFGSEAYGATSSITQFLAYVTLLEGGIGGVARAALYGPLARNDRQMISNIVAELRHFFLIVAAIFAVYVAVLACCFREISNVTCMDWLSTCLLVVVISISTFGQYFIGISNTVLLQAAQKSYITNVISLVATIVNAVSVVILVYLDCNIIVVKLASSCIFFLRPVILWLYVKKAFNLPPKSKNTNKALAQKWEGLGQHIAYFLHTNTDIVVLTCLANLRSVAVYTVYNMVVTNIQNLAISFVSGMEALFGDMLAKKEYNQLCKTFGYYEMLISMVTVILFSVTAVMIVPFVKIYTAGITDADYIAPVFAVLLVLSGVLYCLRMPYHSLVIAAGHFRQTRVAAYAETAINVGLSIMLVGKFSLIGVAAATVIATGVRFLYYVIYLSKNIIQRRISLFAKRILVNVLLFAVVVSLGSKIMTMVPMNSYGLWAIYAALTAAFTAAITLGVNFVCYKQDFESVLKKFVNK